MTTILIGAVNLVEGKFIKRQQYPDVFFAKRNDKIIRINLLKMEMSEWTPTVDDLLANDWEIIGVQ